MGVLSICGENRSFYFFEELSKIPHGSFNTKAISDWIVSFAVSHGLRYIQDDSNNVIIFKDATCGYEDQAPVILQGHMDMVCVHTDDYDIDLSRTPVSLCTDGQWIWADRTSLGGDNGVAVAIMMAILEDDSIPHPALECVFTSDEEPGMLGAQKLDVSVLKGRWLLNLDSGPFGVFTVNCAGGVQVNTTVPLSFDIMDFDSCFLKLSVSGLLGGHSGNKIHLGRGNSNKIIFELLSSLCESIGIRLCTAKGGKGENVIPSFSEAVIAVPSKDAALVRSAVSSFCSTLAERFASSDPSVSVSVSGCNEMYPALSLEDTSRLCSFMAGIPDGLQSWDTHFDNLPRTSLNMGILKLDSEGLEYHHYIRSSVDSEKNALASLLDKKARSFGGKTEFNGNYCGWEYDEDSSFRPYALEVFKDMFGYEAKIKTTHAGLECGTFYAMIPGVDIVTTGADQKEVHSVNEKLGVRSMIDLYDFVCAVLRRCGEKI